MLFLFTIEFTVNGFKSNKAKDLRLKICHFGHINYFFYKIPRNIDSQWYQVYETYTRV